MDLREKYSPDNVLKELAEKISKDIQQHGNLSSERIVESFNQDIARQKEFDAAEIAREEKRREEFKAKFPNAGRFGAHSIGFVKNPELEIHLSEQDAAELKARMDLNPLFKRSRNIEMGKSDPFRI